MEIGTGMSTHSHSATCNKIFFVVRIRPLSGVPGKHSTINASASFYLLGTCKQLTRYLLVCLDFVFDVEFNHFNPYLVEISEEIIELHAWRSASKG
jgi:hypothetical protein